MLIYSILFILSFLVFFSFYFIIIPVALFMVKFIIYYFGSIQFNYNLNETQARIHNNNIRAWHSLENNQTIRLVISSTYTENNKNNAGVSNNYQRDFMHIIFSLPWFIKSNIPLVQLKLKGGKVIILPGLGAKADRWFQRGEKGDIIGKDPKEPLTVSKDGGQIDAITASTITSRAFLLAVNNAYNAYKATPETDTHTGATKQVAE